MVLFESTPEKKKKQNPKGQCDSAGPLTEWKGRGSPRDTLSSSENDMGEEKVLLVKYETPWPKMFTSWSYPISGSCHGSD